MKSRLRQVRLSPALVISAIALFFAIGGLGYAAATIGTKQLKNNSVTTKKIKNHTIKKKDLGFDPTGAPGATGPAGPAGPMGPAGSTGAAGPASISTGSTAKTIASSHAAPTLENGGVLPLAVNQGFAWALTCSQTLGDPTTSLVVQNVSGGNNSHINGAFAFIDSNGIPIPPEPDDFDQDEVAVLASTGGPNNSQRTGDSQGDSTLIYGANGDTTQMGWGGVLNNPTDGTFDGDPDCAGSLNLLVL